ncbi:MAG: hypothetical protein JNL82_27595 [Myxococcales bacterium]|jgi:hypothetical protein|nr:hypothetical protein [Myxococcales bacterium]
MGNAASHVKRAAEFEGALAAALVDSESGMILASAGQSPGVDLELAAAGNTEVLRAKQRTIKSLGLVDDVEDVLITLTTQYHLIRPLQRSPSVFYYLVLDRSRANLALARRMLAEIEANATL